MKRRALLALALVLVSCDDTSVNANNSDPEAVILAPAPDYSALVGDPVTFRGSVEDGTTAATALEVSWSSSLDGILDEQPADSDGTTTFSIDTLRGGEHTITLRVVDAAGASGVDAISITIEEPQVENTAPTCAITSPADDAELSEGDTVVLEGTAGDAQSPPTDLVASWSSSEDGDLGTVSPSSSGAIALPVPDLSAGTHVLTLDVEDPEGLNCSEFVVVQVIPDNYPPSVGAPSVSPDPLYTADQATCTAPTPTDPEGDTVSVELRWLVNGADVGVSGPTLPATTFVKGDGVQCTATPSDATGAGATATSATVVVADTGPTQPGVGIAPPHPTRRSTT
jgi:hypothetical protein